MEVKIKIDLVRLIQLAAPQVARSDERALLYRFLAQHRGTQIVNIDLGQVLITGEENANDKIICPYCGNPDLEQTAAYTWCPACDSGLFFRACPLCDGDLEASLDPVALCNHCGQVWGEPVAEVGAIGTDVAVPSPTLTDLTKLRTWLGQLVPPE